MYKFEQLEIWQLAIEYIDVCYLIIEQLPKSEEYNLASQLRRASTSVALNIAEGSTGLTDAEQSRFLSIALRSLIETVACQHLIFRRHYLVNHESLREAYRASNKLSAKIQAMRRSLNADRRINEIAIGYETPFDEQHHDS